MIVNETFNIIAKYVLDCYSNGISFYQILLGQFLIAFLVFILSILLNNARRCC